MAEEHHITDFQRLIERRRKFIEGLDANKGEINLDIFEDFYPDRAHFIYELLQNAEDAGATEVNFTLSQDRLVCEHDGRTFTLEDVTSITGLHDSTKANAKDKIGKFGVGFKSVFVYTQAPTIRSGAFAFRIVQLILPELVAADPSPGARTRFEFPFDNPKKVSSDAYAEIKAGLNELDEKTLLFLSSLRSVKWQIGTDAKGEVLRRKHSDFHFEVLKLSGGAAASSSHFLKFEEAIPGLENQRVALAFPLGLLAGIRQWRPEKSLVDQVKIVAAELGSVAVFFPAAKEMSGLRFHLHGPFVPELSRASIKETPANEPLFEQLARLCAHSLHKVKHLGLLTPEFLAILPNLEDQLPARYRPVRDAIIHEMKSCPLTPTHARGHAAADRLVQARASLKNLLSENDIEYLVEYEDDPPLWAMGATQQNNRVDKFLDALAIKGWGIDEFVETLCEKADTKARRISKEPYWLTKPDDEFMNWLEGKSPDWLQQFYALLHDEDTQSDIMHDLSTLKIVRLKTGEFATATQCFFTSDSTGDHMPTVEALVYTSGKSKPQQEKARKFLSDLGVRELGEAEEVELILKTRYTKEAEIPDEQIYWQDFQRFVALVARQPESAKLFAGYYIFHGDDDQWHTPVSIYLDQPYMQSDLSAYYSRMGDDAECAALHSSYTACGIGLEQIGLFAQAVGARLHLKINSRECWTNPQWSYLSSVGGDRNTSPINRDYYISNLSALLEEPSLELSRLIWRTLAALPTYPNYLQATYQRNQSWGAHQADSVLVHELRDAAWVPQGDGTFVRPAEAHSGRLPEGFPYDSGSKGLKAIQFGSEVERQSAKKQERDDVAKIAGFADASALERAKRFAALPEDEQERFFAEREAAAKSAIPDRDPANPDRRARNVSEQAENAPDKESEIRSRSVSIGREDVKVKAEQYLRQHYRNADGEMTCQICKGPLPFKLDDGSEFFETVEFLPGLQKRHYQNYLALCPNHSAMFRHANGCREIIRDMVESLSGNELEVVLAQQDMTLYLSTVHVIDIKAVLTAESNLSSDVSD